MSKSSTYTTKAGDTWDLIAFELWGDEFKMTDLQEANLEYADILIFDAGVVLAVPEIDNTSSAGLPSWKQ